MSLGVGARLGHYTVTAKLGSPAAPITFDVSPDGLGFLSMGDVAASGQIHIVLNWHQEVAGRVPVH